MNNVCDLFQKQKIYKILHYKSLKITDIDKLPNDKRWAPILHLLTWKQLYNMNFVV